MRPILLLLLLLVTSAAPGAARTLYWRALDVSAELDRDGRLHVRERHSMVFNGAWNGGEREFRLEPGQRLQRVRVAQVDPVTGTRQALVSGNLSAVGHYQLSDGHVLRWRSRLPSDPPFHDTELVVEIDYVLSNILLPQKRSLLLDHDFAFSKRPGRIERYTLDFRWDPAWQADSSFTGHLEQKNLAPGRGVVLTIPFSYVAAGAPAGVRWPLAAEWRYGLLLALLGFIGWRLALFRRHEKRHGRYAPLLPVARIDKDWLEKNIFCLAPEVAGAAWDKATAAPEVAAVLARMSLEGKIASEVKKRGYWLGKRHVLHLRLLCKREDLQGHEKALVAALFIGGSVTDTDQIREYYRQRGFNPADSIRAGLTARVKRLRRGDADSPRFYLGLVLFLGAVAATAAGMLQDPDRAVVGAAGAGIGFIVFLIAMLIAQGYDQRVLSAPAIGVFYFIPLAALVAALVYLTLATQLIFNLWTLVGLALLCAAFVNSQLNLMRSRDTAEFTGLRKRLVAARRYFKRELRATHPRLQDDWLPYLLAFGLGTNVDKWFRAHGAPGHGVSSSRLSGSGASAAGTQAAANWSGGGGSFAGAGATGTWVVAVGGLAASIPAPSSGSGSSSGGGGGGGGGSSGGGGGGGW